MATKICPICNKAFTAHGRQKYCSKVCQDQGRKQTLKNWKDDHNYNATLREKRQAEREKISEEAIRERHEWIKEFDRKHMERMEAEQKARQKELKKLAKAGDPEALMILAEQRGDRLEYWRYYALYEIEKYETEYGYKADSEVNGYSVYLPDFAELVLADIKASGKCIRRSHLGKKLPQKRLKKDIRKEYRKHEFDTN